MTMWQTIGLTLFIIGMSLWSILVIIEIALYLNNKR